MTWGLFAGRVPEAAKEFAASGWDRLYPLAWSLTGNKADAEDLVQQSLVAVLTRWERIERAGSPDAYVRRLLVNLFLDGRRRRSSSEVAVAEPADRPVEGDFVDQVVLRDDLASRLSELPPRSRAVLVLRYYEDLSDAAIAEIVGTSQGNVRVIAHRGLTQLRSVLGELAPSPQPRGAPARLT